MILNQMAEPLTGSMFFQCHGGRRPATHDFPVYIDKVVFGRPSPAVTVEEVLP